MVPCSASGGGARVILVPDLHLVKRMQTAKLHLLDNEKAFCSIGLWPVLEWKALFLPSKAMENQCGMRKGKGAKQVQRPLKGNGRGG